SAGVPARAAVAEFGEGAVEGVGEEVSAVGVDAQRWLDLEDVEVVAGGLDDDAEVEHAFAELGRLLGGGFQGLAVAYQFQAEVEAAAVHGTDDGMVLGEGLELCLEAGAGAHGVALEVLVAQGVQDGEAGDAGDG